MLHSKRRHQFFRRAVLRKFSNAWTRRFVLPNVLLHHKQQHSKRWDQKTYSPRRVFHRNRFQTSGPEDLSFPRRALHHSALHRDPLLRAQSCSTTSCFIATTTSCSQIVRFTTSCSLRAHFVHSTTLRHNIIHPVRRIRNIQEYRTAA